MKKAIFTLILFAQMISLLWAQTIEEGKVINKRVQLTGDYRINARDAIYLKPGFHYTASSGIQLIAKIVSSLVLPVDYQLSSDPNLNTTSREITKGSTPVGSVNGSINVNPGGAAVYSIPLSFPTGISGMQPNFSVVYSSQGGNGMLGMGWNLSGISAISRTSKDIYHDGVNGAINLNSSDKLALDGQRLIPFNNNGQAEFRTENEGFSSIVPKGTPIEGMPAWFEVKLPNGYVCEYGNTADSRVEAGSTGKPMSWYMNKITDINGNYMLYTYIDDNTKGEHNLDKVEYTGKSTTANDTYYSVRFYYESRNDKNAFYTAGTVQNQTVILNDVKCYYQNTKLIKEYKFTYTQDLYSHLSEVVEYGTDGSKLNSTLVNYGTSSPNAGTYHNSIALNNNPMYTGDFNGDGRTDVVTASIAGSSADYNQLNLYLSETGSNYDASPIISTGFTFTAMPSSDVSRFYGGMSTDFNGDGKDDLMSLAIDATNTIYTYSYLESDGQHFNKMDSKSFDWEIHECYGDFDGDSYTECLFYSQNHPLYIWDLKDNSYGSVQNNFTGYKIYTMDIDGDRIPELLVLNSGSYTIYKVTYNSNQTQTLTELFSGTEFNAIDQYSLCLGDFNGDGKTDLYKYGQVYYSTGIGFIQKNSGISEALPELGGFMICKYYSSDYNGDGKSDLLQYVEPYYSTPEDEQIYYSAGGYLKYYYSNGVSFVPSAPDYISTDPSSGNYFAPGQYQPGDVNGDGLMDRILFNSNLQLFVSDNSSPKQLVTSIANGHNVLAKIEYKPLTDASVYTKYSNAQYPLLDYQAGSLVVSGLVSENGNGGENRMEYKYEGAKIHRLGRGMLGFSSFEVINTATSRKSRSEFDINSTFYVPYLARTYDKINNNTLSSSTLTHTYQDLGNKRFLSYVSKTESYSYDHPSGNQVLKKVSEVKSIDTWYRPTQTLETVYNGSASNWEWSVQQDMAYTDKTTNNQWILGLVTQSKSTRTKYGQKPVVRTNDYEYFDNGILKKQIIESGNSKSVTTEYTYDVYGNPLTVNVSATGLATRTISYTYDSRGRFPTSVTNSLNHIAESTFDPVNGFVLSTKAPNNLVTTYKYDGFGRVTEINKPGGIKVTSSINWAGSGAPTAALYYTSAQVNTDPAVITWYDKFGREIRKQGTGFDGSTVKTDTRYDNQGRVYMVSPPYFGTSVPLDDKWLTYAYDVLGRASGVTGPLTNQTTSFSGLSVTSTDNLRNTSVTKTIDAIGNTLKVTDAGGSITYNILNSGLNMEIYDATNNKTTVESDIFGNRTTLTEPNAGTVTSSYDAFGQLLSQTDFRQKTTTFEYDKLGRTTKRIDGPDFTSTFTYDTNGKGLLSMVTSTNGSSVSYTYDNLFRPVSETKTIEPGQVFTTGYTYDSNGRTDQINYPTTLSGSFSIKHVYNTYGYLSEIRNVAGNELIWKENAENEKGLLTSAELGNGITTTYGYSDIGQLQSILSQKPGSTIQNNSYAYNSLGMMTSRSNLVKSLTENFEYDNLERLTRYYLSGQTGTTINYNNLGNIMNKADVGNYDYELDSVSGIIKPNAVKKFYNPVSGFTPNNMNISYNNFGKVSQIINSTSNNKLDLTYTYDGQRCKTVLTSNNQPIKTKYFVSSLYEKEVNADNSIRELLYIYGGNGLVAIYEKKSNNERNMLYVHTNHLGSLESLTNSSGAVIQEFSYDAWGKRSLITDNTGTGLPYLDRGYTMHEHLDMFGVINMNGRVFDPVLARFLSPDNFVQDAGSQGYNRYSYCLNNPLMNTDPSGYLAAALDQYWNLDKSITNYDRFYGFSEGGGGGWGGWHAIGSNLGPTAADRFTLGKDGKWYSNSELQESWDSRTSYSGKEAEDFFNRNFGSKNSGASKILGGMDRNYVTGPCGEPIADIIENYGGVKGLTVINYYIDQNYPGQAVIDLSYTSPATKGGNWTQYLTVTSEYSSQSDWDNGSWGKPDNLRKNPIYYYNDIQREEHTFGNTVTFHDNPYKSRKMSFEALLSLRTPGEGNILSLSWGYNYNPNASPQLILYPLKVIYHKY